MSKNMQNSALPNKCKYCGFRQVFPPETGKMFQDLKILYDKKIINQIFPRKLYDGDGNDRDEFCLISNPSWHDINKPCADWLLGSKSAYDLLPIQISKETEKLTAKINWLTKRIYFLTVAAVVVAIIATYVAVLR